MWLSLAFLACAGCSFFAVHGPSPTATSSDVSCTEDSTLPALDAIAGALAIGGGVGGELVDQTSHPINHYELYYGLPAVVLGIVLLVSTSNDTDKIEACQAIKHGTDRGCDGCPAEVP